MTDQQSQSGAAAQLLANVESEAASPVTPPTILVRHPVWSALMMSATIVAVHMAIDWVLLREGGSRIEIATESGAIIGIVTFVLLLQLLRYNCIRRERLLQRMETIDEMNHHIRNALQVIAFNARPVSRNDWELAEIKQAVSRINWTLREVLPKMEPEFEMFDGAARENEQIKSKETGEQVQP